MTSPSLSSGNFTLKTRSISNVSSRTRTESMLRSSRKRALDANAALDSAIFATRPRSVSSMSSSVSAGGSRRDLAEHQVRDRLDVLERVRADVGRVEPRLECGVEVRNQRERREG